MNIFDLLNQERTQAGMDAGSKKKVLENLSAILSRDISDHSQERIFDNLISRERLGSTGLGSGVALPHCRLKGLKKPCAAMATLQQAIDFNSPDNKNVDIVFCLIVPEESNQEHLQILAHLANLFSHQEFCQQLRQAKTEQEILNIIKHWQQNVAA